jgi:phosphoribosyl 1,2-cyclic phosphate phosphodiesterase
MLKVTFLGTGTSQGVPVIACDCDVCASKDSKDKRLRCSILVEWDDLTLVVDTGPDFRQQMLTANVQKLDAVVFTHEHKDHVAGMDDVRAFNFKQQQPMEVYADQRVQKALKREYEYVFAAETYPGIPKVNLNDIQNQPFTIKGKEIIPIEVLHYKLPVFGFRFGDFTYITDANYISEKEMEKIRGSKVIVLNALRKAEHVSHFTLVQAVELLVELAPEKGYLTHISHLMGKHEDVAKELPAGIEIATDGLSITM